MPKLKILSTQRTNISNAFS